MNQILLYSPTITNRLRYIATLVLEELLGLEIEWITDLDGFRQINQDDRQLNEAKLNYSQQYTSEDDFWMPAVDLLFEKGIKEQDIEVLRKTQFPLVRRTQWERVGLPYFFKAADIRADLSFDLFAMCFYLVSRYEEYLPFEADQHGRFSAKVSLAFSESFLNIPLVNLWAFRLGDALKIRFPKLVITEPSYRFLPTIDVDMAWAYLHKGILRNGGAFGKALLSGQLEAVKKRWAVLSGKEMDPFNTFLYLAKAHAKTNAKPIFFFLLGKHGKYDKNTAPNHPKLQQLIQTLCENNEIGMHPSYGSNTNRKQLFAERQQLEKISSQTISKSRQHFLKLHLPTTYQELIALGISDDYSMGYAAEVGFRASIASPFYWYDLEKEEATSLKVHPFQVMDVTLKEYLKYDLAKAKEKIAELVNTTRIAHGQFSSIWHNSSFAAEDGWKGWEEVYEFLLDNASE